MSRHRSSHNPTDTNPGSVPLAPDCHKSDEGSQQDEKEGQTEKSKSQSHTALIRQQGGTNSNLWTGDAFITPQDRLLTEQLDRVRLAIEPQCLFTCV